MILSLALIRIKINEKNSKILMLSWNQLIFISHESMDPRDLMVVQFLSTMRSIVGMSFAKTTRGKGQ